MAIPTHDYEWEQGTDLVLQFVYKQEVDSVVSPVDLTGYSLRMDIRSTAPAGQRVWTFNSDDIAGDTEVDEVGEADNEATLNADGEINITVPRALTLAGGAIHTAMAAGITVFAYDIILRNAANKQSKILSGKITVNESVTLWA